MHSITKDTWPPKMNFSKDEILTRNVALFEFCSVPIDFSTKLPWIVGSLTSPVIVIVHSSIVIKVPLSKKRNLSPNQVFCYLIFFHRNVFWTKWKCFFLPDQIFFSVLSLEHFHSQKDTTTPALVNQRVIKGSLIVINVIQTKMSHELCLISRLAAAVWFCQKRFVSIGITVEK